MHIDDKFIGSSLSEKDSLIHQHIAVTPQPVMPRVPRILKKTHLERMPFSGTTSAVMEAIRRVRVERLPEFFEQTCDRRLHETAVICGSAQLTYQELDQRANRLAHFLISRGVGKGNPVGILHSLGCSRQGPPSSHSIHRLHLTWWLLSRRTLDCGTS